MLVSLLLHYSYAVICSQMHPDIVNSIKWTEIDFVQHGSNMIFFSFCTFANMAFQSSASLSQLIKFAATPQHPILSRNRPFATIKAPVAHKHPFKHIQLSSQRDKNDESNRNLLLSFSIQLKWQFNFPNLQFFTDLSINDFITLLISTRDQLLNANLLSNIKSIDLQHALESFTPIVPNSKNQFKLSTHQQIIFSKSLLYTLHICTIISYLIQNTIKKRLFLVLLVLHFVFYIFKLLNILPFTHVCIHYIQSSYGLLNHLLMKLTFYDVLQIQKNKVNQRILEIQNIVRNVESNHK
eukprot:NODE_265_length_11346_cov_0.635814.p3 type:complete len:296 gc:universal NODE_265_length_11346_cov_0.635814:6976-7863(+)